MKNYHKKPISWVLFILLLYVAACSKKPTDYRSFLNGEEIVYPGVLNNPVVYPGNGRLMLTWQPNSDPSVTRYVVYWNNYADSLTVSAGSHNTSDTVKCIINNLSEYAYTFFIRSFDGDGNKSIISEIDNARVYGSIYESTLHNRLPYADTPFVINNDGSVRLNFSVPDTINITTQIKYVDASGTPSLAYIAPDSKSITLPSYKPGEPVIYQSTYIPSANVIDTFSTLKADTFPAIKRLVDVTGTYIQNAGNPFLRSDNGTGKWGLPLDWQTNTNVLNQNGGTAGGWSSDYGGVIHFEAQDWTGPGVNNGKVYQTITLPAGDYSMDFTSVAHGGSMNVNLVAAAGNTLPDITNLNNVLGLFAGNENNINGTNTIKFSLPATTTVSVGWVVSTQTTTYVQFTGVKLWSLQ